MKDCIISKSLELLRKDGLRFSVDTLAESLNISKKTVYKYFPNKEALALEIFQKYYAEAQEKARLLTEENSPAAHIKLLFLYLDAKSMARPDVFNKYKLNEALYSYTSEQNNKLCRIIFSSLDESISEREKESLKIILNGSFEKLCNEKIAPEGVIDRLVHILWQ